MLPGKAAPNGVLWSWEDCARECASRDECHFWTLQLRSGGHCMIMSRQGRYHEDGGHIEGPKHPACLKAKRQGPFAGSYTVSYKGTLRQQIMTVHCNSSVS